MTIYAQLAVRVRHSMVTDIGLHRHFALRGQESYPYERSPNHDNGGTERRMSMLDGHPRNGSQPKYTPGTTPGWALS